MSKHTWIAVLLLCLWTPLTAHNRAKAREAYQKARSYHDQLLSRQPSERTGRDYRRVIYWYRRVLDHDPTYGACDDALFYLAEIHQEMGERWGSKAELERAVYYYEFLADQYPSTRFRKTALERAAHLRARQEEASRRQQEQRQDPKPSPADLATVSEIRYWSSEDYTRVVIQLDREVEFQKNVLRNPDRIYFDLEKARLKSGLGKNYTVNGLFIQQVRVAQNRPDTVRVVLDFEAISNHTVFALYDPFRIVIDTRREKGGATSSPVEKVRRAEAVIPLEQDSANREVVTETSAPEPNLRGDWSLTRTLGLKVGKVVLDPGHGGQDRGTIGPSGLTEKELVLDVALRLKKLLEEKLGTEVVLTREDDRFVPLEERTAIANQQGADLFISIHANWSRSKSVSGAETFFLNFSTTADEREVASRENAASQRNIRELEQLLHSIAKGDYTRESQDLAHVVQQHLHEELSGHRPGFRNRGVKKAPFIVLIGSNMPSILTEIGFLSNPDEEAFFKREEAREQVAQALYTGIREYFRSLGSVGVADRGAASGSP